MKIITFCSVLFLVIFLSGNVSSQTTARGEQVYLSKLRQIAMFKEGTDWITIKPGKSINAKRIFEFHKDAFGLGEYDKMKLIKSDKDKIGFTTHRYQQYYKGIPVDGAVYLVHEKNGKAVKANGKLVRSLDKNTIPSISPEEAIQKALLYMNASKYMWEDTEAEKMLKKIKADINATYYPDPKLVMFDKKFSKDPAAYKAAYKMEVYSEVPHKRMFIYVDSQTGEILHTINMIQTSDKTVIAPTMYNNQQPMVIDSAGVNSYRLRETGRGGGIQTFDLHNSQIYSTATDITDTDTVFDTDIVANNAHWAAEQTYDYYLLKHGRNSYNDNGGILLSYVHFGSNVANAQWDGTRMSYGDGDGSSMTAFTTIDICGHEITHGVTQFSANLVYQDEPGAMNEAISDIFGTCIEYFADTAANWLMGEDIGDPIRSMSNPKAYQQPNTYHGQYWNPDPNNYDNGGVHTNSGVLNYWFYLLCAGGTGTNDNGYTYQISPLGMDTAAAIAYRMLTAYLTETSQYSDAYLAGLNAANDLYGSCSQVEITVAAAFAAVGVGYPISNDKIYLTDITSPVSACGLSSENISVKLLFNGCNTALPAGGSVVLAYSLDNGIMNYDTMITANPWNGGDTLSYTIPQPIDVSTVGQHKVDVWVKYITGDTISFNDSIKNYYFSTLLQQNTDFGMAKVTSPNSGCGLSANEIVQGQFLFLGCDSFPAGDTIALAYSLNDGPTVIEKYVPQSMIYPGDTLSYTFLTPCDISNLHGTFHIDMWTAYVNDANTSNNTITRTLTNPISLRDDTVNFDLVSSSNYFYLTTTNFSKAFTSVAAHHTGPKGLQMTGGNPMLYIDQLQFPDGMNTWTVNAFLSAKANFCVDATGWTNASLKFDLKQTHGGTLYSQYLGDTYDFTKASNLRILINGQMIGTTYNPTTAGSDPWVTHVVNLDQYAGTQFIITFETRNIGKDTSIQGFPFKLDNAYIDNVVFDHCTDVPFTSFNIVLNNLNADFTNQSQGANSYLWDFGDGTTSTLANPQHTYDSTGSYTIHLYATNSCGTDTFTVTKNICDYLDALFSSSDSYLSVDFINQSQGANSYLWDFGDGTLSTSLNPQHIYNSAGAYTVKLFATNLCGTDSFTYSIQVCDTLQPLFVSSAVELSVSFTNQSLNATSYIWDFGDGDTSASMNPQHVYDTSGTYTVTLSASNSCETGTFIMTIQVSCNVPQASFAWSANFYVVNFTNSSQGADSYLWVFGDGDSSTVQNPQHTYDSSGTYTVVLYAQNSCGTDTAMIIRPVVSGISSTNLYHVQVYPNPVKHNIYINFEGTSVYEEVNIRIADITGKIILAKKAATHGLIEIPVTKISAGIYLLEISGAIETKRMRIEVE